MAATVVIIIGGAVVNELAFSGSNYAFSTLSIKDKDKERARHDQDVERLQNDQEDYSQDRSKRLDWLNEQLRKQGNARYDFNDVDEAFLEYQRMVGPSGGIPSPPLKGPHTLSDYRYKGAKPLKTKKADEVAKAFAKVYSKGSLLKWPNLLQVDRGTEFYGEVTKVLEAHNVNIRRGQKDIHKNQGIVERFNRTLAERLFSHQYAIELNNPEKRSREWVSRLPSVINAINNEETRLSGLNPSKALRQKEVTSFKGAVPDKKKTKGFQ